MAPSARYIISAVTHQKIASLLPVLRSSCGTVFCGKLLKLHGNVKGVVYIIIFPKVAVPVNNTRALR